MLTYQILSLKLKTLQQVFLFLLIVKIHGLKMIMLHRLICLGMKIHGVQPQRQMVAQMWIGIYQGP